MEERIRSLAEEALRYLGAARADRETHRMAEETAELLTKKLRPQYTWRAFRLQREAGGFLMLEAGIVLGGTLAERMLADCETAVLLTCTLGAAFDRMLQEWQARDMARAAVLDACGSAFTEAGCDEAGQEIASRFAGQFLTDRFSPGYGDLPLTLQGEILRALDATRRLGVTANESCLLIPCKSVTAVIGLSDRMQPARIRGCGLCGMKENCKYRKKGETCGV